MKSFISQFVKTKCEVVVNEENLTRVLEVLNRNRINSNLSIGSCDWVEANMWYIGFSVTRKQMASIKSALKKEDFKDILIITNTNTYARVEKLI